MAARKRRLTNGLNIGSTWGVPTLRRNDPHMTPLRLYNIILFGLPRWYGSGSGSSGEIGGGLCTHRVSREGKSLGCVSEMSEAEEFCRGPG